MMSTLTFAQIKAMTKDYCRAVARDWASLKLNEVGDKAIPLESVFVHLQAQAAPEPTPIQKGMPDFPPGDLESGQREGGSPRQIPPEAEGQVPFMPSPAPLAPPLELGEALQQSKHLVILGAPGAGKSTVLQFLGLCFAQADEGWGQSKLGIAEPLVPVLLKCESLGNQLKAGKNLATVLVREVASRLQSTDIGEARLLVEKWLEEGRLLLLADGLDEVSEQEGRQKAIDNLMAFSRSPKTTGCRLVVSSRPAGYHSLTPPFRDYWLLSLGDEGARCAFLSGWLGHLTGLAERDVKKMADDLLKKASAQPALRRLLDNPLLLRLLAEAAAAAREHPAGAQQVAQLKSRAQLYENYFAIIWRRSAKRGLGEAREGRWHESPFAKVAEALAWHLQSGGTSDGQACGEALCKMPGVACQNKEQALTMFSALREKMGLLVQNEGRWGFAHLTMAEALIAKRLRRAWDANQKRTKEFLKLRLHLPEWREPLLLFFAALEGKQAQAFSAWLEKSAKSTSEKELHRDSRLAVSLWSERGGSPALLAYLEHRHERVRKAAAKALGEIRDPAAVPALEKALVDDEAWGVRIAAAKALGEIRDPAAVPALEKALGDDEAREVREAAAAALGEIKGKAAVEALIRALGNEDNWVRITAARTLREMRNPATVEALLKALGDKAGNVRQAAAGALGWVKDQDIVEALLKALGDKEWYVRTTAAGVLGAIKDSGSIPALVKALDDEDLFVREAAAAALGAIKDSGSIPALVKALGDEDFFVREAAAKALWEMKDAAGISSLLKALGDNEAWGVWVVRAAAAAALGEIKDPAAVPALVKALGDEEWFVRKAAAEALGKIKDSATVEALLKALDDKNGAVRYVTARALGEIKDPATVPALEKALGEKALGDDEAWGVRAAAAGALGEIRDPAAVPALLRSLGDRKEKADVRSAAAAALSGIFAEMQETAVDALLTKKMLSRIKRRLPGLSTGAAEQLLRHLERVEARRLSLRDPLAVPSPSLWERGYSKIKKPLLNSASALFILLFKVVKDILPEWLRGFLAPLSLPVLLLIVLVVFVIIFFISLWREGVNGAR